MITAQYFIVVFLTLSVSGSPPPHHMAEHDRDPAALPTADALADQLTGILHNAIRLEISSVQRAVIYEAQGTHHSLEAAGDAAWFVASHEGYAQCHMTPNSYHLETWRGDKPVGKPLMILNFEEGLITEQQWRPNLGSYETAEYAPSRPGGVPDITLQSYFYQQGIPPAVKVCNFAYQFRTWIGTDSSMPQRISQDIRNAAVSGMVHVDGRSYYTLTATYISDHPDGGHSERVDLHWIDTDTGLVARWDTMRTACSADGEHSDFMNEYRRYNYALTRRDENRTLVEPTTP
jgi:hypothetical protein